MLPPLLQMPPILRSQWRVSDAGVSPASPIMQHSLCVLKLVFLCGLVALLRELHWLKVPQRIQFRLCVLTYRCLHGSAASYLAETIHRASSRATRHLRSANKSTLLVPSTRRSTLGDRAFPAAAARALNSLPTRVRNAPTLVAFRRELKTVLFRECFSVD